MSEIGLASGWKSPRIAEIGGGLVIASYLRKMLTLACVAAVLPACLITDRKEYQAAPSFPPSIISAPTTAPGQPRLDRITVIEDVVAPDGGIPELRFEVVVREPNVNDAIRARVFVNRASVDTDPPIQLERTLVADPTSVRPFERPFDFVIDMNSPPFNRLVCNKIELVVASDFDGTFIAVDPNESARVVWWAGPRGVDIAACNL